MIRRGNLLSNKCSFFINGGSLSESQSLQALHLSGAPSLTTSTSPPTCQLHDNRLYFWSRLAIFLRLPCAHFRISQQKHQSRKETSTLHPFNTSSYTTETSLIKKLCHFINTKIYTFFLSKGTSDPVLFVNKNVL